MWILSVVDGGNYDGLAFVEGKAPDGTGKQSHWVIDLLKIHVFKSALEERYFRIPNSGFTSVTQMELKYKNFQVVLASEFADSPPMEIECTMFEYAHNGGHVWWHGPSMWNALRLRLYPGALGYKKNVVVLSGSPPVSSF